MIKTLNESLPLNNETPSERTQRIIDTVERIASEIERLAPTAEIVRGKYTTELIFYNVSVVNGKIVTSKETRTIYIKSDAAKLLSNRYLSRAQAEEAVTKVMPKAQEHFKNIVKAYKDLASSMGFTIGYTYEGDTHGIYDEYQYISFDLDGFHFTFAFNE